MVKNHNPGFLPLVDLDHARAADPIKGRRRLDRFALPQTAAPNGLLSGPT